jgi:ficolin
LCSVGQHTFNDDNPYDSVVNSTAIREQYTNDNNDNSIKLTLRQMSQTLQRIDNNTANIYHHLSKLPDVAKEQQVGKVVVPVVSVVSPLDSSLPRDCYDIVLNGDNESGVYTIYAGRTDNYIHPIQAYCEQGGWTVFQSRQDGSENFYRDWNFYTTGFGNLLGEFWLGNDNLYAITRQKRYKLRIDMEDFSGNKRYAEYDNFKIGNDCEKYILKSIGRYTGNAGDSLSRQVGHKFSTHDQDNDAYGQSCATLYKGAWWYDKCHLSNLNGYYYAGNHTTYADGINWHSWTGYHYSLRLTEMKIKPFVN